MADDASSLPSTAAFEPGVGPPSSQSGGFADEIQREMLSAWQAGSAVGAEQWLDRHPEVKAKPELAVMVIYEELCLREERGDDVDSEELYRRFPQYRDALSVVLDCHRMMNPLYVAFPTAGEEFGEFRLLRELGRGGAGRVFLATQPSLSDRPLVVKLTRLAGEEHLSLARLQHTHIVPLFLVQEFPDRNLRGLCMPFLGGASWAMVLKSLDAVPAAERSGQSIVQAIERAQLDLDLKPNADSPAIGFLSRATYEQAVCWIGSCLADALSHAHQRGLMHLDIKPSNVLLASDGQPMLLDFHLAHEVRPAAGEAVDRVGGTPGYMSPEQQRCVDALRAGRSLPLALDPRSDIYSLGVLLYESLVGRTPGADERRSRRALRKSCPLVGRGLEDLLHKCLAWNRESRYADAGELAADLRRQMANLPLRGVANRSLRERWRKWRRRKPHALGVWAISLAALTAIGGACGFLYSDRAQVARTALRQAAADLAEGNHAAAVDRLTLGLQAARWLPGQQELKQSLQSNMADARRAGVLAALRGLVEQLRFLDSADDASGAKLRELDAGCRAIWEARRQIVPREPRYVHGELVDEQIDLLDLALLWTRLMTRFPAAGDPERNRSKALSVLDEAERMWGPRAAIALATAQVKGELATSDRLDALLSTQPRTSWEHDAVGRILMQSEMLEPAREQFELATRRDPGAFWPNFHLALCAYRSERFDEALRAACICVALSPRRAECFFNRGLCYRAIGEIEAAQRDFERAIELDPNLAVRVKSLPAISASK